MFEFIFILFCITSGFQSNNPISSLTRCPSGTNDCVKNFVKELYALALEPNSDIGAEELDPLFLKQTEGSILQLKLTLTNTTLRGFRTCEVQYASYDLTSDKLQTEFICKQFVLKGQYEMTGRLLTEPIEGDGTVTVKTGKYRFVVDINLETNSRKGINYKHIKSYILKAEPIERMTYDLTNLFGGDKQLGDSILKLMNENWKAVAFAYQDPTFGANFKKVVKNINKYLKTISID